MRRVVVLLLAGVVTLLLSAPAWAGGGGHGIIGAPCDGFGEGQHVALRDKCFDDAAHFVQPDEGFTVRNAGGLPHTYTALDGTFDTGVLGAGARTHLAVAEPGVYKVVCTLHAGDDGAGMSGVLVVGDPFRAEPAAAVTTAEAASAESSLLGVGLAFGVVLAILAALRQRRRTTEAAPG